MKHLSGSRWEEVTQPAVHAKGHGKRLGTCPPSPAAFRGKCLFSQAGMDPTSSTSFLTSTAFAGTAQGKVALLPQMEATFWGANLWAEDRPKKLSDVWRTAGSIPGTHHTLYSVPVVRTHWYTKKSMWDVFKLFTVTLLNSTNYKTATVINRLQLIYLIAVNKIIQSLLELGHYIIHYISVTQWF